ELAQRRLVLGRLLLGRLLPLRHQRIELAREPRDDLELLLGLGILAHRRLGTPQRLVLVRLADQPAKILRLLRDHRPISRRARRYRARPNRSSWRVTSCHPAASARAAVSRARRASSSRASQPPSRSTPGTSANSRR